MKRTTRLLIASLALFWSTAHAGHHFETRLAQENTQYDMQDIYAFQSTDVGKTVFIMTFNPTGKAGDATTFGNDGLYHFHIGENAAMTKGKTFTFQFAGEQVRLFVSGEAFPKSGTTGKELGVSKIGIPETGKNGIRFWADTVHDPFTGNGTALNAFKKGVGEGKFDAEAFSANPGSLFGKSISGGIVFEVPNGQLPKKLFYCASSSKNFGKDHWHRINRIGHVLLPHLYMEGNENITSQNGGTITEDSTRRPLAIATIERYALAAGAQKDSRAYAEKMAAMILPDSVPYAPGTMAKYALPLINGRALSDDAMDTAVEILVGKPFPAFSGKPDKFKTDFPYLLQAEK